MRLKSAFFIAPTLIALSGFGLYGCDLSADDEPPDISEASVHHYRIVEIDLPETNAEAIAFGIDLDADDTADNQLGRTHSFLRSIYTSFQVEAPARARLMSDVIWTLSLYDAGSAGGGARISRGTLSAGQIVPLTGEVAVSTGPTLDGREVLRGGGAFVALGAISDPAGLAPVGWLPAAVTAVRVERWDDGAATVTLGVGLLVDDVKAVVFPSLAAYFTTKLDDPEATFANALDADDSGVVTVEELAADSLIRSLLAADLEGYAISLGIRLHATAL